MSAWWKRKAESWNTGDEARQSEWQDGNNKKWKSWDSQASSSWQEAKSQAATPVAAPPLHLPAQFDSDGTFLDKTVVGQHQLYRQIQSTNCSRKRGLAGRSVEELKSHEKGLKSSAYVCSVKAHLKTWCSPEALARQCL